MKGKLIRLSSTHNNLRTDIIDGHIFELPKIGYTFSMVAAPSKEHKDARILKTTEVLAINKSAELIEFKTKTSLYKLQITEHS